MNTQDFIPKPARRGRVGRQSVADDPEARRRYAEIAFLSEGLGYSDDWIAWWFGRSARTIRRWANTALRSDEGESIRRLSMEVRNTIEAAERRS